MGRKTHPLGFRLGITQTHQSSWYSSLNNYSNIIKEDFEARQSVFQYFERKSISDASISNIYIKRNHQGEKLDVEIKTAQPGIVVGKKGSNLRSLHKGLSKRFSMLTVKFNVIEILEPYQNANILADFLVEKLQTRVPFRRAMKEVLEKALDANVLGIKVQVSGRLNGAEIARTEWIREGRVPLQTLRANIDYSYKRAKTTYGILGVKIWIFTGESLEQ